MLAKFLLVFRIPELRQKILLTLVLLAVYRMGFSIPLPFIDQEALRQSMEAQQSSQSGMNKVMTLLSLFSASNISQSTIFGLGIMPYISASIIFQLMGQVYPPLEKLQKEGEAGRRKINEYTRYATVLICLGQSFFWIRSLAGVAGGQSSLILKDYNTLYFHLIGALTMTTGTVLLMWIGEQIDEYGIGNGISLLIMANILAQMPRALMALLEPAMRSGVQLGSQMGIEKLLCLAALFVIVVLAVVAITQGTRRIPMQSAKHVRGRRVLGGQRQFLPLKVNQSGVMPIVFASSLLTFPYFLFRQLAFVVPPDQFYGIFQRLESVFANQGYVYNVLYVALIYFFCYFWTAISFNPKDMSENLKDYGSFIPGIRPGERTASYLEQVMTRITYVGAAFLAVIAIIPTAVSQSLGTDFLVASFFGGTGLLICVSVALDLVQKIDSHLIMRSYPGLLDSSSSN